MEQDLNKYKNTVIKLVNIYNGSEIYGYLLEQDEKTNKAILDRAILSINRMVADPAGTFKSIIKYEYNDENGNVITVPASTIYTNYDNKHITYINLNHFLLIPLYDNSYLSDKKLDKKENMMQIKETFENYIEHIYSIYSDVLSDINVVIKQQTTNEEDLKE